MSKPKNSYVFFLDKEIMSIKFFDDRVRSKITSEEFSPIQSVLHKFFGRYQALETFFFEDDNFNFHDNGKKRIGFKITFSSPEDLSEQLQQISIPKDSVTNMAFLSRSNADTGPKLYILCFGFSKKKVKVKNIPINWNKVPAEDDIFSKFRIDVAKLSEYITENCLNIKKYPSELVISDDIRFKYEKYGEIEALCTVKFISGRFQGPDREYTILRQHLDNATRSKIDKLVTELI